MEFISYSSYISKLNHPIKELLELVYQIILTHQKEKLEFFIIFGSFAYGKPDKNSDLDIMLLYSKDVDLPGLRKDVFAKLPSKWKNKLDIAAYSIEDFEMLYKWNNSLCHGGMAGITLYLGSASIKLMQKFKKLREDIPVCIRRDE